MPRTLPPPIYQLAPPINNTLRGPCLACKARRTHHHVLVSCRRCMTSGGQEPQKAEICTDSTNQQWILKEDNTLRPKNHPDKCIFLIEPTNRDFDRYGFKLLDCSSNYPHKQFYFEYMTNQIADQPLLHTFFKIKLKGTEYTHGTWNGQSICIDYGKGQGEANYDDWLQFVGSCSCPVPYEHELFQCVPDYLTQSSHGVFVFEPVDS